MKVTAQLFTRAGHYGERIAFECRDVSNISQALVERLADLPDTLEGERFMNWNRITIEVTRDV